MLKPRHCYQNEEVYNMNYFMEYATVRSYALDPGARTQIKFGLNNEKTKETGMESRFIIVSPEGCSRAFFLRDVEEILNFISLAEDPRVSEQRAVREILSYYKKTHKVHNDTKTMSVLMAGRDVELVGMGQYTNKVMKEKPDSREQHFNRFLGRFKAIIKEFELIVTTNKDSGLESHFQNGRYTMVPLNNSLEGVKKSSFLRADVIPDHGLNHIWFSYKDKGVLLYGRYDNTQTTTTMLVEKYISALLEMVDKFNAYGSDVNTFVESIPVVTEESRKHFMEYVGGRGYEHNRGNGYLKGMFIQMNSDAAPAWSKVMFRYEEQFVLDLIKGLRLLTALENK